MKTRYKILLIIILALIVIQFFPIKKNTSNEVPTTDLILVNEVPSQVATLIHNACYDCHSNNTNYPWYDKIKPFAWYLDKHIKDGKAHLNFNLFEKYSLKKQQKKLREIKEVIQKDKMPLTSYQLMHAESRLSKDQQQAIINWVDQTLKNDY